MADAVSPSVSAPPLRKTALHAAHVALGARMVPFGGWDMPVEYSGITAEHLAVRTRAGLFDVSHMGEIEIAGADAPGRRPAASPATTPRSWRSGRSSIRRCRPPRARSSTTCSSTAGRPSTSCSSSTPATSTKDYAWIQAHIAGVGDAVAVNSSSRYALIALQGPKARSVLQPLTGVDLADIKYYWFAHGEVAGVRATVSRTGYTGEDGFEIFVRARPGRAPLEGAPRGRPAGGHRPGRPRRARHAAPRGRRCGCTATTSTRRRRCSKPASAGSSAGRRPISSARRRSTRRRRPASTRKLVGFEMIDRGIARARLSP